METLSRFRGCLLGLAAGDALGTTLEFRTPGSFTPLTDMTGGGPFHLQPGQWTDDTSMALCLAESLVTCQGFDARDQMQRYLRWYRHGYLSSTGACFDIGGTTRQALTRFELTGDPHSGPTEPNSAGNGSLMRLAPVPIFYHRDPAALDRCAAGSSRTTHAAPQAVEACVSYSRLIAAALRGASKVDIFQLLPAWSPKPPARLKPTGYVVDSLETALNCFHSTGDFRDGCLMAANLGGDSDTIAAIFGQLAGAFYGESGIPAAWLERLAWRAEIAARAEKLFHLAQK